MSAGSGAVNLLPFFGLVAWIGIYAASKDAPPMRPFFVLPRQSALVLPSGSNLPHSLAEYHRVVLDADTGEVDSLRFST